MSGVMLLDITSRIGGKHSAETVWATISLKDQRKLVVGSYYRPPDSGSDSIADLESVLFYN